METYKKSHRKSVWQAIRQAYKTEISKQSICHILKHGNWKSYILTLVHVLNEDDPDVEFC